MIQTSGRKRVIISNIQPVVDGAQFPAKAIQHQALTIAADVFCDGHDSLRVQLQWRHQSAKIWSNHEMLGDGNDRYSVVCTPDIIGNYEFRIKAWIDPFSGWLKGLKKKHDAGQELKGEIAEGISLVQETLIRTKGAAKATLRKWIQSMESDDIESSFVQASDEDVMRIMAFTPASDLVSESKTMPLLVERKRAEYSTWYELFPRSAGPEGRHGSFRDVQSLLPQIAQMGFDVLYLPPIHPIGTVKRKGKNNSLQAGPDDPGSPWAIGNSKGGHKSIHPELGTLRDFKALVKAADKLNIEIAMDIALQCAPDHPYVQEHPEWFRHRADGTIQYAENPPKKYEDIVPFNFETSEWKSLWEELKSIFVFWVEAGVKIFRVDNPHTKSFAFWEWLLPELRKSYPELVFLSEAFTRPRLMERLAKAGFSQSYTYFTWRNTKAELETYIRELCAQPLSYYFRPNFWPNTPDILPPFLSEGGEPAHIIRLLLAATLSPSYGIYGPPFEFGYTQAAAGKEEYADSEKYEIKHWNFQAYTKIRECITRINRIRKTYPAFQRLQNLRLLQTDNDQLFAFYKEDELQSFLLVFNLDPHHTQSGWVQVPAQCAPDRSTFMVKDLLSGDTYSWQTGANYVMLHPGDLPVHIFLIQ